MIFMMWIVQNPFSQEYFDKLTKDPIILHLFKNDVRRYYNYGRDYFTNGLPEGYMGGLDVDEAKLQEVLETIKTLLTKTHNYLKTIL